MALLPITIRRRLRDSGFSEEQTDALDEVGGAAVEAARVGLAKNEDVRDEYASFRLELQELAASIPAEMAAMRADMNAMKWWLFGTLSLTILAATAAIIAAIAVWG